MESGSTNPGRLHPSLNGNFLSFDHGLKGTASIPLDALDNRLLGLHNRRKSYFFVHAAGLDFGQVFEGYATSAMQLQTDVRGSKELNCKYLLDLPTLPGLGEPAEAP
jgi:hypothetical protein